ncbi:unnamed protein product, partial [Discosporangium mesarthrocarpum]
RGRGRGRESGGMWGDTSGTYGGGQQHGGWGDWERDSRGGFRESRKEQGWNSNIADESRQNSYGGGGSRQEHGWGSDDAGGGGYGERQGHVYNPHEEDQRATTRDLVALGKRGLWKDVVTALVGARVRGVPLNEYMYNSAINAMARNGRWKEAISMLEQMRKDGLNPDGYSYCSAINACANGSQWEKALTLLREMPEKGGFF